MIVTHHEYRHYVFSIEYHAADPAYAVDFPDFPEIITSGVTLAEAFASACEALDLHLERAIEREHPSVRGFEGIRVASGRGLEILVEFFIEFFIEERIGLCDVFNVGFVGECRDRPRRDQPRRGKRRQQPSETD